MGHVQCSGWWEQAGLGRQPMRDLVLSFAEGQIAGTGVDIVGEFELRGELHGDKMYLRKHYIGSHVIEYHGLSVGEGGYTGVWTSHGEAGGNWFIGIVASRGALSDAALEDLKSDGAS
ncbi:MAG: hypothetical protein KDA83_10180 [Planctomycetales bacterium]|nr:hypothetical protein [Planctomycetales bacterium]